MSVKAIPEDVNTVIPYLIIKGADVNCWWIATRVEDLTNEEIEERAAAFGEKPS